MLAKQIAVNIPKLIKRNYGVTAPAFQKATDPIQQLFVDKIREYKSKGGALTPAAEKELKAEREKIMKQYAAEGQDMTSFPKLTFTEPQVEVNIKKA